ncbi:hypothetical protein QFC20_001207 [Naganishia adeliensis]|uniref:Uncharacterized protein n=1 Tax=Naganishia adeliensis TaxID=92952 RepID=A0ACC2WVJ4_9TREE|nr:hypothetical protein QFC20_001207 [Naganishia adeliensis]
MASLAGSLRILSLLSRSSAVPTSKSIQSTALNHGMNNYFRESYAPSRSYRAFSQSTGTDNSMWRGRAPGRLRTSISRNPDRATSSQSDMFHTDYSRDGTSAELSFKRDSYPDYLSGGSQETESLRRRTSFTGDQSHDGTSALSLLLDAKRANKTAKSLKVLQKCLQEMEDGDPTKVADLARTLAKLAQDDPYMCKLIPGLRPLTQPFNANVNAARRGQMNPKFDGRRWEMDAKRPGRLHLPEGSSNDPSAMSSAGSNVSSTASDAHSPAKPTPPIQLDKQQHDSSDSEYGENLPEDDDDDKDDD